jgi:hypothetical protein
MARCASSANFHEKQFFQNAAPHISRSTEIPAEKGYVPGNHEVAAEGAWPASAAAFAPGIGAVTAGGEPGRGARDYLV